MSDCCAQPGLMSVEQALQRLLAKTPQPPEAITVNLTEALGCILAQDTVSQYDVPPADNSAMDGYCLRFEDFQEGKVFAVSQRIPAGAVPTDLEPGTVARIFTGAEVPNNADVVIMQENVTVTDDGIIINETDPELRQHIRPQGQDIEKGATVLAKGSRIRPQEMGLLASIGIDQVSVYRPLKVAVLSTGDEIIEPGNLLQKGQIFNSNRYTLTGLINTLGLQIMDLGIIPDDISATKDALTKAAEADVIITSGGVSVGEEDHVKNALDSLGEVELWKLAIKPGKPFTFGHVQGTPFLGLPGNPAAVFITFCILCRPWLLQAQGATDIQPTSVQARAGFSIKKTVIRQQYLQARLMNDEQGARVEIFPNQSSGILSSASWANAVAVVPANSLVAEGDQVNVIPFNSIL